MTKQTIQELIDRETSAWDKQDVELLLSIFHPDMVLVWPRDEQSHDPIDWEMPLGKFNYTRWKNHFTKMFEDYELVNNDRETIAIIETAEHDGAFAVVDIDTLWENKETGNYIHWWGRTCKTYTQTAEGFKLIAQTGVLSYE